MEQIENQSFPEPTLTKGKKKKVRVTKITQEIYNIKKEGVYTFGFSFFFTFCCLVYICIMTVSTPDTFPLGYFYILSKMNGLALDIDKSEPVKVSRFSLLIFFFRVLTFFCCCRLDLRLLLLKRSKRKLKEIVNSGFIKMVSFLVVYAKKTN